MKALMLTDYSRFAVEEMPQPAPGPAEVLIRVKACGVCGSDVHGMDGSTGRRRPPIVMGHEAAGVIAAVGSAVADWHPGDRVTFDSTVYCGACWFCRRGEINLCEHRRVLGVSCEDYRQHGAFAEFVAVPQHILYRLPDSVSFAQAAMVEALSIAVHAIARTPLALGDTVAVIGAGMIGLLVIQTAKLAGAGRVLALDLDQGKLDLALQLGADAALKVDACDAPGEVLKLTGGRGADAAFEVVGVTPALNTAVASLRKGGALTLVGNLSPRVELPLQAVVTRQLQLIGSCASAGEYPVCLDLIAQGKVNVDALVSAVAPLEQGGEWFHRLHAKEPGLMKVILTPDPAT